MSEFPIGVVGAGVMGCGIVLCAIRAGFDVVLVDIRAEALEKARAASHRGLRLTRMLKGALAEENALGRIHCTTALGELANTRFVIESIHERIDDKEKLFRALDEQCEPSTFLVSNTSAIPIARLAAVTKRPARVLGVHFMNPAPLTTTVELVRAPATSDETVTATKDLLSRLGKDFVEVRDGAGFVSNRVLMLAVNEAIGVLADARATPSNIDRVFTACLGHKTGPLATADLIGLDVILDTLVVLAELADPKFRPHPLLLKKVARGELGVKTQKGFFDYPEP